MNTEESLRFIDDCFPLSLTSRRALNRIILEIANQGYSDINGFFEFSTIEGSPNIRFLHLAFPKSESDMMMRGLWIKKRTQIISRIASRAGIRVRFREVARLVNISLISGCPLQIGCESQGGDIVIKIYLSVLGSKLEQLNAWNFGLRHILEAKDWRIDSLGMNLPGYGNSQGKVYAYRRFPVNDSDAAQLYDRARCIRPPMGKWNGYFSLIGTQKIRHWGPMFRLSSSTNPSSIKLWARFETPVHPELLAHLDPGMNDVLGAAFEAGARISYLTLERDKRGVYFR